MRTLLPPCKPICFTLSSLPPLHANKLTLSPPSFHCFPKPSTFSKTWKTTHVLFCSKSDVSNDVSSSRVPEETESDRIEKNQELELRSKPSPVPADDDLAEEADEEPENPDKREALAPFLKFFKPRDSSGKIIEEQGGFGVVERENDVGFEEKRTEKVNVEYYEPKPGDFVVGVVVSGNENKLDVNIGADLLGTMLTKEVLPLYDKELEYLLCDLAKDAEEFMVEGKMGIVKDEAAVSGQPGPGKPVVETGTVLFAEVLGRTLSGRPLLSTRRLFRKTAWHRVRQIKELNEPIEVKFTEWNTGGLLTRIEGLRAFLPKVELMRRVKNFKELKENVGRKMYVLIVRVNETTNELILSEKEAWEMRTLREGTLLEGTVKKIYPYGAQVKIGETNRSGLLHISNISRGRISSVDDYLKVDEKVKVLVVKSVFPDKISFSIAELESEPGLFISNKKRVFAEAEEMAKKYRKQLHGVQTNPKSEKPPKNTSSLDNEASLYSNWNWFKFERE